MKYTFLISLLFVLSSHCVAQEGTNFEDLTLKEALQKAKDNSKKLFIDCYTKTCGPCKYMLKFIFPLKECGDYFNNNYICIMKDMEEGEGIDIAKNYNVQIYPTYLILNHDGTLYCRLDGGSVSSPKENFVQKVKNAIELAEFDMKYAAGERDEAFLKKYINLLRTHNTQRLESVISESMLQLGVDKLCKPQNWNLIKREINNVETPLFRYLIKNRQSFSKCLGQQEVEEKIITVYSHEFRTSKMMGIDFDKRMADLKQLEKDHYTGARPLRYRILFFQTIHNKQTKRTNEILKILKNMNKEVPDEHDRMTILQELKGFEQIADQQQKEKARIYLQNISNKLHPDNTKYIQELITRITE